MINVNKEKCIGCSLCVNDCIVSDIDLVDKKAYANNIKCNSCGHCIAICPKNAVTTDADISELKDYSEKDFSIAPDNLLNFIKFRRSIRNFKNKDVENEKLLKIIEAGRYTQTGSNSQNVSYIVVKNDLQTLRRLTLRKLNSLGENILKDKDSYPNVFTLYANMWMKMYEDYNINPDKEDKLFFHAPAVILVISESPVNASLASSNMELMTNTLGLGTFFSGFLVKAADGDSEIMDFLGLKEPKKIVTCMVIGYPNVKYLRTVPRKQPEIAWK